MWKSGLIGCLLLLFGSVGLSAEFLYTLEDPTGGRLWYGRTVLVGNGEVLVTGGGNYGTGTGAEFMHSRVFVYDVQSGALKRTVFDPEDEGVTHFGSSMVRWATARMDLASSTDTIVQRGTWLEQFYVPARNKRRCFRGKHGGCGEHAGSGRSECLGEKASSGSRCGWEGRAV